MKGIEIKPLNSTLSYGYTVILRGIAIGYVAVHPYRTGWIYQSYSYQGPHGRAETKGLAVDRLVRAVRKEQHETDPHVRD